VKWLLCCIRPIVVNLKFSQFYYIKLLHFISYTEAAAKTGMILLLGEITSKGVVDYQKIVRDTVRKIGYDDTSKGKCVFTCKCKRSMLQVYCNRPQSFVRNLSCDLDDS